MGFITDWLDKPPKVQRDFEVDISDDEKVKAEEALNAALTLVGYTDAMELAGYTRQEAMELTHTLIMANGRVS